MSEAFIDRVLVQVDLGLIEIEMDSKSDGKVYIHHFKSLFPGEGNASEALKAIVELASENDITLVLFPSAEDGEGYLSQDHLVAWYERMGFRKGDFFDHYEKAPEPKSTLTL